MKHLFKGDFLTDSFDFRVDDNKCTRCGRCIDVCSSQILYFPEEPKEEECGAADGPARTANNSDVVTDGGTQSSTDSDRSEVKRERAALPTPKMKEDADGISGWAGCYRCQRCMAVCPTGAVSILNKDPEISPSPELAADFQQLDALMRNRRSCRSFLDKEVPREEIDAMLDLLENAPTGSNRQSLEFSVVYSKYSMDRLRKIVHRRAFELAEQGIYPGWFTKEDWDCQTALEDTRNHGDMFFVGAPHILIIHSPREMGCWHIDPHIAAAWFDLICASRGLGSIIMTMPVGAISKMPDVQEILGIPEDRYYGTIIGFGYPKFEFARGVQREGIMKTREIVL